MPLHHPFKGTLKTCRHRESIVIEIWKTCRRRRPAVIAALARIASDQEVLEVANRATQHLYFTNPIKKFEERSANLFSTHPAIVDRINRLRELSGERPLGPIGCIGFIDEPLGTYRLREGSESAKIDKRLRALLTIGEKYGPALRAATPTGWPRCCTRTSKCVAALLMTRVAFAHVFCPTSPAREPFEVLSESPAGAK